MNGVKIRIHGAGYLWCISENVRLKMLSRRHMSVSSVYSASVLNLANIFSHETVPTKFGRTVYVRFSRGFKNDNYQWYDFCIQIQLRQLAISSKLEIGPQDILISIILSFHGLEQWPAQDFVILYRCLDFIGSYHYIIFQRFISLRAFLSSFDRLSPKAFFSLAFLTSTSSLCKNNSKA